MRAIHKSQSFIFKKTNTMTIAFTLALIAAGLVCFFIFYKAIGFFDKI